MPAVKSSPVHPPYKTEYHIRNRRQYEQGLRARGDVTIWFSEEATANWIHGSTAARGGPRLYSDLAIETALTIGTVFGLALRQTEGFFGSLLRMPGVDQLAVADHSTRTKRDSRSRVRTRSRGNALPEDPEVPVWNPADENQDPPGDWWLECGGTIAFFAYQSGRPELRQGTCCLIVV